MKKYYLKVIDDPLGIAQFLEKEFNLIGNEEGSLFDWCLELSETGLALTAPKELKFSPFRLNFDSKRVRDFNKNELLARAVFGGESKPKTVLDFTAGLGRDAFLLSKVGHCVTMIERHPVLAAMLYESMVRLKLPLKLIYSDSQAWVLDHRPKAQVVYLDPMFPVSNKTALVKKEMQILHHLVGKGADDLGELFALAKATATEKVILKRPLQSDFLFEEKPLFQLKAKTHRFDVYAGAALIR